MKRSLIQNPLKKKKRMLLQKLKRRTRRKMSQKERLLKKLNQNPMIQLKKLRKMPRLYKRLNKMEAKLVRNPRVLTQTTLRMRPKQKPNKRFWRNKKKQNKRKRS